LSRSNTATFWSSSADGTSTRILLIRHGRVAWNARAAYTGWTDLPLDERGEKEAMMVANRLKDTPIGAIYASDLNRARRTAEIIAEPHNLKVQVSINLREINYGEWEGLEISDVKSNYGEDVFNAWSRDPVNYRIPGGETFGELRDRAAPEVERIASTHPGQTVVVAAHRSVNRVLICHWLGLDVGRYKQIEQKNGAINSLLFNGNRVVIETVNDVCHIEK
jgi:alpha-ribazole phosphatase/probable phosphoglycerate mutase